MNAAASECLVIAAPARRNLFLHVLGRRQDGLHKLQTLVSPEWQLCLHDSECYGV